MEDREGCDGKTPPEMLFAIVVMLPPERDPKEKKKKEKKKKTPLRAEYPSLRNCPPPPLFPAGFILFGDFDVPISIPNVPSRHGWLAGWLILVDGSFSFIRNDR